MIDKLQAHYGFTRMPFGRDLAPGMLHRHAAHNEAVARITWCITERAIGVITGEVGAGKTASVRTVLAGLDPSRHTIIYLPNPMIGVRGLHEMIVATFGGQPDRSSSRLTAQASAILAAERDERGKTPVLVIDEAHLLRYEQLETIRMLTNHNLDADSPLACLLVGQPTLRRTMKLAVLAALEQRIALRYTMPPMTRQETASYITHHLKLAGRADTLFSDDAGALIHTTARGYPRASTTSPSRPSSPPTPPAKPSSTSKPPAPPSPKSPTPDTGTSPTTTGTTTTKAPQPTRPRGLTAPPTSASPAPPSSESSVTGNSQCACRGLVIDLSCTRRIPCAGDMPGSPGRDVRWCCCERGARPTGAQIQREESGGRSICNVRATGRPWVTGFSALTGHST